MFTKKNVFLTLLCFFGNLNCSIEVLTISNNADKDMTFEIETTQKRLTRRGEGNKTFLSFEGEGSSKYSKRVDLKPNSSYEVMSFDPRVEPLTFIYKDKTYKLSSSIIGKLQDAKNSNDIYSPKLNVKIGLIGSPSFSLELGKPKSDYIILGIPENSPISDIKSAFKKLSLKWHPDRWNTNLGVTKEQGLEKFKEIGGAYDRLKQKLNFN